MSHCDRAFYADAAGEVGAGQGSRELQRPSCGKLLVPGNSARGRPCTGPVGRGRCFITRNIPREVGGGARLTEKSQTS